MQEIKNVDDSLSENDIVKSFCKKCNKDTLFRVVSINENITGMCGKCRGYKTIKKNDNFISNQKIVTIPKCPTCQSTDIKKITVTSKAMNTALFGLFGTKRHKTFHCNNCGYEW